MQKSYGRLEQNKNKEIVTKNDQPASGAGFERAVLVAVIRDQQDPRQAEEYLAELEFLAETAGIVGVRRFTQRLPQPSARIYVGPGKLEEIAAYCKEEEIDVAIFDDELSPSQTRNIEAAMPCRILDRTLQSEPSGFPFSVCTLPPRLITALEIPFSLKISITFEEVYPFAIPPRSIFIPSLFKMTSCCFSSYKT